MTRVRPGWLVALSAGVLAVSVWLPWLTTSAGGGGHASAIGGTVGGLDLPDRFGLGQLIVLLASTLLVVAAMAARNLSPRVAAGLAVANSVLLAGLIAAYHRRFVTGHVVAGYGFYIAAGAVLAAVALSVWTLVDALMTRRTG